MKVSEVVAGMMVRYYRIIDIDGRKYNYFTTWIESEPWEQSDGNLVCKISGGHTVSIKHLEPINQVPAASPQL